MKDAVAAAKRARDLFIVVELGQHLCRSIANSKNANTCNEPSEKTIFPGSALTKRSKRAHISDLLLVRAGAEVRVSDLVLRIDPRLDLIGLGVLEPVVRRRHTNRARLRDIREYRRGMKRERERDEMRKRKREVKIERKRREG